MVGRRSRHRPRPARSAATLNAPFAGEKDVADEFHMRPMTRAGMTAFFGRLALSEAATALQSASISACDRDAGRVPGEGLGGDVAAALLRTGGERPLSAMIVDQLAS